MDIRESESSSEADTHKFPGEVDEEKEDHDSLDKSCEAAEVSEPNISVSRLAPKRKKTDMEREVLESLCAKEDRHLSFFKGLLPSLQEFSDDETLQFQSSVINIIQEIKKARSSLPQVLPQ